MNNEHPNMERGLTATPNLILKALKPSSHEASLRQNLRSKGVVEVSAFGGAMATPNDVLVAVNKLMVAFPKMANYFWELLAQRISERGMTAAELDYAVNEVIDNFTYQNLTIADILKQGKEKRFKLRTYEAMLSECNRNGTTTNDYCAVKVRNIDKPCWVSKADKVLYNIPDVL